jgi:hypothetical protein
MRNQIDLKCRKVFFLRFTRLLKGALVLAAACVTITGCSPSPVPRISRASVSSSVGIMSVAPEMNLTIFDDARKVIYDDRIPDAPLVIKQNTHYTVSLVATGFQPGTSFELSQTLISVVNGATTQLALNPVIIHWMSPPSVTTLGS